MRVSLRLIACVLMNVRRSIAESPEPIEAENTDREHYASLALTSISYRIWRHKRTRRLGQRI
jgi:hypothetical protein